jgi:predicted PurR-regulated permease PerM
METKIKHHNALDLFSFIAITFIAIIGRDFFVPLLFAAILSVLIFPTVRYFENKICFNRIVSISISITIFTIIIFAIITLIGYQFNNIMEQSDQYYEKIEIKFQKIVENTEKSTGIQTNEILGKEEMNVGEVVKKNSETIFDFLTRSGSLLGDFVLTPLYMFFFLLYRNFLISFVYKATSGINTKGKTKQILNNLYDVQQNYLTGLVSVMLIVGVLNSIGLLALGIDYPFFFGFLCALLLLIPYVGIIIGSLLPALIALATKDSYWYAIGVIGIFGFIQFIEGNFITPQITGNKVSLNSFFSILAIVLFSMLWGIPGMILALPITASLKVIFDQSEKYQALGFLLGVGDEKYFSNKAKMRLKIWKEIRKHKNDTL